MNENMVKKQYATVLDRYEDFWEHRSIGRPLLNLTYPIDGATAYRAPVNLEEKFLVPEYSYNLFKHNVANRGYLAEGIPMCFTNFGPGCLSACLGGSYVLASNSIWFDQEQFIKDWETPPEIAFDEQSILWQKILETQALYAEDPDVHFSITDLGGIMDIVASMRGTQELLFDLLDYPDEVKSFAHKVTKEWIRAFDRQVEIVGKTGQPYNNWMNIPSSKPWYPLQCDFSYMISPSHFEEFVLPDLIDQAKHMERSIYHLDGVGEINHLDLLLDVPEITGIQWVPGAGNAPVLDEKWFGLYRKIQDKKKNIVLHEVNARNLPAIERLVKTLDPAGVYLNSYCPNKDSAEAMLEKVTRWCE
jgi:5-methyltetrahydrofolate--homocysteine methyltransferase